MRPIKRLGILLLLALLFSFTLPVSAESINVACTPAALRDAIVQANNSASDTTIVLAANCTYNFNTASPLGTGAALPNVGSNITIQPPAGSGAVIARNGGPNFRLFYVSGGHLSLNSVTVQGGIAPALGGGGIYVASGAAVTLDHSALISNSAPGLNGGGILAAGTVNLFNTTVSGNSAGSGGGLYFTSGSASIRHATIAANTATGTGGGIRNAGSGSLFLYQSIVGNNTGSFPADFSSSSGLGEGSGFNIFETSDSDVIGTNVQDDPGIGPLANNGGATLTHLPGANSAALETGDPLFNPAAAGNSSTDQRGQTRVAGLKTDVGAVEVTASGTVTATVTSSLANGTYSTGTAIPITITFSTTIQFQGTPLLTLETRPPGEQDTRAAWPIPPSTSPTSTINLTYTVADGDNSADLDYVAGQPLFLPQGASSIFEFTPHTRILSTSGLPVNVTFPAPGAAGSLGANKNIVINSAPYIVSVEVINPAGYTDDTVATKQTTYVFRLTFSEPVRGVDGLIPSTWPDFNFAMPPQPPPFTSPLPGDVLSNCGGATFTPLTITNISPSTPRPPGSLATVYNVTVNVNGAAMPTNTADCTLFLQVQDYPDDTNMRLIMDASNVPYRGVGEQDGFPMFRQPGIQAVRIDYVPPDTRIIAPTPGNNSTVGQTVPVYFEVLRSSANTGTVHEIDPTATTQCVVQFGTSTTPPAAGWVPCTSPWAAPLGASGNGTYTVFLRSTDALGNGPDANDASNRRRFNFSGDVTNPDTQIVPPSPAEGSSTNANPVNFSFTATGADGTPTFQCDMDGDGFSTCTSPFSYPDLQEGTHTFRVFAIDQAGSGSGRDLTPATRTFNVDRALPVATITSPANDNIHFATAPAFSFTANEPSSFQCSFRPDGSADVFAACTSPFTPVGPFTDGIWVFKVRATDAATNQGEATLRSVVIDATGPDTTINTQPTNPTADSTPDFTFSSSEGGTSFQCRLYLSSSTPPAFSACNGGAFTQSPALTVSGSYTFNVRALDFIGNPDATPATYVFTVDVTPPNTTITLEPDDPTNDNTPTWNFTANEPATFQCSLVVQGQPDAFGACSGSGTHTPSPLADATYTFKVRATDVVGLVDPTPATDTVTVSAVTPNTFITLHPPTPTNDSSPTWEYAADRDDATFVCSLVPEGQEDEFAVCPGTTTGSFTPAAGLRDGTYTFKVSGVADPDLTGGVYVADMTPAVGTVVIVGAPPDTLIVVEPTASTSDTMPTWEFVSNEAGSTFQCSLVVQGNPDVFGPCNDVDGNPTIFSHTPASPLAQGTYTFKVRATDIDTNTDPTPATDTVIIDVTAPDTTITVEPSSPTNDTTPTWEFTSTEVGSTFECSLVVQGQPDVFLECTGGSLTQHTPENPLANGTYTFKVRATDAAGASNVDATPATDTVVIDTVAPNTTITLEPDSPTNDTTPTWNFTSNEPGSTFQCSLVVQGQPDAFGLCVGSAGTHTPASPLANGTYTFKVRAVDLASNVDATSATDTVVIDTAAPPNTTITLHPPSPTDDTTPTWEYASDQSNASFVCSLVPNGQEDEFAVCPGIGTGSFTPASDLRDGTYVFKVSAVADPALTGGVYVADQTPATSTVVIVGAPPDTLITLEPNASTNDTTPTWEFVSNEAGSTFQCSLVVQGQPDAFGACNDVDGEPTIFSHTSASALAEDTYTFSVRATDLDSNVDPTPATDTVTIDTTPPDTTITVEPSSPTNDTTPTWEFTSTEVGSTFECSLVVQGQPDVFLECTGGSLTQHTPETPQANGTYTFKVRATDAAGATNVDATPATDTVVIDTVAPLTSFTMQPPAQTNDTTPSFAFSSNEPVSDFECRLYRTGTTPPANVDCDSGTYAHVPALSVSGNYVLEVQATDMIGNSSPTSGTATFNLDLTAPQTTIIGFPFDPTLDTTPTWSNIVSSEPGSTLECSLVPNGQPNAFGPCSGPGNSHTPSSPLVPGTYMFRVRAMDPAGNVDVTPAQDSITISTTVAPNIAITSNPPVWTNDTTPTYTFITDDPSATFECSLVKRLTSDAFGACSGPGGTHTPASPLTSIGQYSFKVRARNTSGVVGFTAEHVFNLDLTAPTTTITQQPSDPTGDTTPYWVFQSTDGSDTFQCSLVQQGQPDAFSACSGAPTHTPPSPVSEGTYSFKVRSTDLAGNVSTPATDTVTISIEAPDTILYDPGTNMSSYTYLYYEFEGDPSNVTFECSLVLQGQPDNFESCVGDYWFEYEVEQDGTYVFKVRAVNDVGTVDPTPASHTILINSAPPQTTITVESESPTSETLPIWEFTSSFPEPGSSFVCSLVEQGQPDDFTYCAGSAFTPDSPLADGTYVFKVKAVNSAGLFDETPAEDTVIIESMMLGGMGGTGGVDQMGMSGMALYLEPEINVTDGVNSIADDTGSYSYPATTVGSPVSATFTVENSGSADLVGSNLSVPAGFSVSAVSGTTIEPGTTETFTVVCDATSAGSFSGLVSFENNDIHESPYDFTLSCDVGEIAVETETEAPAPTEAPVEPTVETEEPVETETPVATEDPVVTEEPVVTETPTPEPTPEPSELTVLDEETQVADNAQVTLEAGETRALTIRNDGAGDLVLERNPLLEGAPAVTVDGGFTLSDDVDTEDTTLASGAEAGFEVSCPAAGGISGTLEIVSNDADENPFGLTLVCAPAPTPEPTPTEAPTPEATQVAEPVVEAPVVEEPVVEEGKSEGGGDQTAPEGTPESADA